MRRILMPRTAHLLPLAAPHVLHDILPLLAPRPDQVASELGPEGEERAGRHEEAVVEIALHDVAVGAAGMEELRFGMNLGCPLPYQARRGFQRA